MTDLLVDLIGAIWRLLAESSPYLLVGFFLAGLIKILIPEQKVTRYLGEDNLRSVGLAALFGAPLPLCSCSVLPAATALRKGGASKGATTSFLISTPETGADSIAITYALIDPIMTVVRPVAAILTAVFTGSLVNLLVRRGWDRKAADTSASSPEEPPSSPSCDAGPPAGGCRCAADETTRGPIGALRRALTYSFGTLMDDLVGWFILGFIASGLITIAIPEGFFTDVVPNGWLAAIVMVIIGTPMYICATSATPIAVALIAKGLSPGAALVLLLVGPATNATTVLVVARFLGKRVLALYLSGVVGGALVLGAFVDALYGQQGIDLPGVVQEAVTGSTSVVSAAAGVIMIVLMMRSAQRVRLLTRWGAALRRVAAPFGIDPLSGVGRLLAIIVLLLAYAATAVTVVGPGEVGWVERFGRVTRHLAQTGAYLHLPFPFERVRKMRPLEVREELFGISDQGRGGSTGGWQINRPDSAVPGSERDLQAEAQVIDGGENILRITYAVHYSVADPFVFQYGLADPPNLIRAFAEAALRRVVARYRTSYILVGSRAAIETETLSTLQADLDKVAAGVLINTVALHDVHAPEAVHPAFRDVASALEDKERKIRQAEAYRAVTMAGARARAFSVLQDAQAYRSEKVDLAGGQAAGFLDRLQAFRSREEITRLRVYYEMAERALGRARLIMLLGGGVQVRLWNVNAGEGGGAPQEARSAGGRTPDEEMVFPFGKEFLPKRKK